MEEISARNYLYFGNKLVIKTDLIDIDGGQRRIGERKQGHKNAIIYSLNIFTLLGRSNPGPDLDVVFVARDFLIVCSKAAVA